MSLSAKDVLALVKTGVTIEAQEEKMKLREAVLELQEENLELMQKIKELEDKLNVKEKMIWEQPYYFKKKEDGTREGPFCPTCYDNNKKVIHLQNAGAKGLWKCHSCKNGVTDNNYIEPSPESLHAQTDFDIYL